MLVVTDPRLPRDKEFWFAATMAVAGTGREQMNLVMELMDSRQEADDTVNDNFTCRQLNRTLPITVQLCYGPVRDTYVSVDRAMYLAPIYLSTLTCYKEHVLDAVRKFVANWLNTTQPYAKDN